MLIFKFTKTGGVAYLSHLDLLRTFTRIFRRAGIRVAFSEGFHPHMKLFFAPPLSVGTESVGEYCVADTAEDPRAFLQKFNACSMPDLQCLACAALEKKINLAAETRAAVYEAEFSGCRVREAAEEILASATYEIGFTVKGKPARKEVRQQIFSLRAEGDRLEMTLACGEPNLRADRLCENIAASYGGELTRLTRTDLLFGPPENLQSFSVFLHPESPG